MVFLGLAVILLIWIIGTRFTHPWEDNWNQNQIQRINNSGNSSNNFCFAVMADNQEGFTTFHSIVLDVNQRKPLFALIVGDLVNSGNREKYSIFYSNIKNSYVPFLVAAGNHDVRGNGRNVFLEVFGNTSYSFSYNNSLFVVLDDSNQKYIDAEQMKFLGQELKKNFRHKFVFLHVPVLDSREYLLDLKVAETNITFDNALTDKNNSAQFMKLMEKYKVDSVFSGHIHGYFNDTVNNVNYFIAGGAGGQFLFYNPEHYFYHYINVCVNNTKVNYEVIKFPAPYSDLLTEYLHTAWMYFIYFMIIHRIEILLSGIILYVLIDISKDKLKNIKDRLKLLRHKSFYP